MPTYEIAIWCLNIAATVGLLFRLWQTKLTNVYRWIFLYFSASVLQQSVLLLVPKKTNLYGWSYIAGQSIKLILVFFVVTELYRLALASQPALSRYGQKTTGVVLAAAAAVAALGLWLDPAIPPGRSVILYRVSAFERTMDTWVLVFLLLISGFMLWFPVRMKRNVVLYLIGFMAHFFARSGFLLLLNLLNIRHLDHLNTVMLGISAASMGVWLLLFNKEGERITTVVGHRWDQAAMSRVGEQLDSINASLMKLSQ